MGFLHLINCLVVTYGPIAVVLKATSLENERRGTVMSWAIAAFVAAQFIKMIVSATFLVSSAASANVDEAPFSIAHELQGVFVSPNNPVCLLDLAAIYYLLQRKTLRSAHQNHKFAIGVSWGLADALLSQLAPLVFNASGKEFSWFWIQASLGANVRFVKLVTATTLVHVCYASKQRAATIFYVLLASVALSSIADSYIQSQHDLGGWQQLGARAAITALPAAYTYAIAR